MELLSIIHTHYTIHWRETMPQVVSVQGKSEIITQILEGLRHHQFQWVFREWCSRKVIWLVSAEYSVVLSNIWQTNSHGHLSPNTQLDSGVDPRNKCQGSQNSRLECSPCPYFSWLSFLPTVNTKFIITFRTFSALKIFKFTKNEDSVTIIKCHESRAYEGAVHTKIRWRLRTVEKTWSCEVALRI